MIKNIGQKGGSEKRNHRSLKGKKKISKEEIRLKKINDALQIKINKSNKLNSILKRKIKKIENTSILKGPHRGNSYYNVIRTKRRTEYSHAKATQNRERIVDELGGHCANCGFNDVLDVHHIDIKNDENNVILLCPNCHALIHRNNGVIKNGKIEV